MKVDFDNLRISIVEVFNELAETSLTEDQFAPMRQMRSLLGGLLACHDPEDSAVNNLSDKVVLHEI